LKRIKHIALIISIFVSLISYQESFGGSFEYSAIIQTLADSVNTERLYGHISELCDAGGHRSRVTFTPGNYHAAEYIAQYFESLPGITAVIRDTFKFQSAASPYNTYPIINVIAILEGSGPGSGMLLMGAHYDASGSHEYDWNSNWAAIKAQGADDNATGVAAVMESARILSNPENGFNNSKSIKFIAFAAEEYHPKNPNYSHIGSLYDAKTTSDNNIDLEAALVLDMFGYNTENDYVEVISDNASLWLADIVYEISGLYVPDLKTNDIPADVPYSDHDAYQHYGFPSILLMENDSPWNNDLPDYLSNPFYHSVNDTIGTLNMSLVSKVTKTALAAIGQMSMGQSTSLANKSTPNTVNGFNIKIYPNPVNAEARISFSVKEINSLSIEIFNSAGQRIQTLCSNEVFQNGSHSLKWNASQIASGLYFVYIRSEKSSEGFKVTLIK
jgi:hypothetical protein